MPLVDLSVGLGNDPAVCMLVDLQKQYCSEALFLSETHLDDYPADCLRRRMKMDLKIVNPSDGRKGGVLMFWRKELNITQLYSHPNYIDVKIDEGDNKIWRLTGMYGEF